mmetsp:Transcript_127316/g.368617  ORF Transcript_127316/g.368617 Transcript_127316/m.368617 type:complete len:240 (-) Transcript_127316:25-744(-)
MEVEHEGRRDERPAHRATLCEHGEPRKDDVEVRHNDRARQLPERSAHGAVPRHREQERHDEEPLHVGHGVHGSRARPRGCSAEAGTGVPSRRAPSDDGVLEDEDREHDRQQQRRQAAALDVRHQRLGLADAAVGRDEADHLVEQHHGEAEGGASVELARKGVVQTLTIRHIRARSRCRDGITCQAHDRRYGRPPARSRLEGIDDELSRLLRLRHRLAGDATSQVAALFGAGASACPSTE